MQIQQLQGMIPDLPTRFGNVLDPYATNRGYVQFMTNLAHFMVANRYCAIVKNTFPLSDTDVDVTQPINTELVMSPYDFTTVDGSFFFIMANSNKADIGDNTNNVNVVEDMLNATTQNGLANALNSHHADPAILDETVIFTLAKTLMKSDYQDPLSFYQDKPFVLVKNGGKWYVGQLESDSTVSLFTFITYEKYFNQVAMPLVYNQYYTPTLDDDGVEVEEDLTATETALNLNLSIKPTQIAKHTFTDSTDTLTKYNPLVMQMAVLLSFDTDPEFESGFTTNTIAPNDNPVVVEQYWDSALRVQKDLIL